MGSFEEPKAQELRTSATDTKSLKTQSNPKKPWIETPLIESKPLSRAAGCRIFLKLENLQPSGSFKSRAMGSLILHHLTNPANHGKHPHFFIPSGGNAGLAAVTAARALSYPCTVVLPTYIPQGMVQRLKDAGAIVVAYGDDIEASAKYMREVLMEEVRGVVDEETGREVVPVELHPYDHPAAWEGNSTLVEEVGRQMPVEDGRGSGFPVDGIVCSVGGGGLMNGVVLGVERELQHTRSSTCPTTNKNNHQVNGYAHAPSQNENENEEKTVHILALETRGADALAQAVQQKSLVSLPRITSLATSLGAVRVAERTLLNVLEPPRGVEVHNFVMDDGEAARGVLRLLDEHRLLVELACGVCVEAVVAGGLKSKLARVVPGFGPESRVVVVVCGGSNVSLEMAGEYRERVGKGWEAESVS
ncbi:hypothetical protein AJ79_02260 [Helicocarpus griseus UAMH5409]|uniref:L-serine ammonia-lyase n=1 Tax=Helicocarpus griseus UAMH5409 TaxID=1447875 RepID=A0A2B7Y2F8_9EURO|nr:hypothetical protein AJ79_02260 [Helicocarpus griseus UAMH5409]